MNDLTFQEIQAFLNGDEEAAAKVYYAYRNLMYFIIASYVDNKDDCDDLLSESFLRLLEARASLENGRNLKSYCAAIARNQALSFLRRRNPSESFDEAYAPSEDSRSEIFEQLEPLLSKKEIMILYYKAVFVCNSFQAWNSKDHALKASVAERVRRLVLNSYCFH